MHRCWNVMVQRDKWGKSCIITWNAFDLVGKHDMIDKHDWIYLMINALLMFLPYDILVAVGYILLDEW